MLGFLYLILFLLAQCSANNSNIDYITVTFYKNGAPKHYKIVVPPTLQLGQKLRIKVENENHQIYTKIKCYYYLNENTVYIDSALKKNQFVSVSEIIQFTEEMAAKWLCYVYSSTTKKEIIDFEVSIKKPAGHYISLFVNGERMNVADLEQDKKKEMDFDATAEYKYHEGELAKIKCLKKQGNFISKELSLYNDTKIFETKLQSFHEDEVMYVKLTKQHHASSVACTILITHPNQLTYKVRLFLMQSSSQSKSDEPIFKVNDLTLAPTSIQEYMYEYYKDESLTIVGYMANRYNNWKCMGGRDRKLKPAENQHEGINLTVTLDYDLLMPSSLDCKAGESAFKLKLTPINTFDPFIHGLSMSRTLLAYRENETNYIMKYNNKENANLNLMCTSRKSGCKWDFNSSEVIAEPAPFNFSTNNIFSSNMLVKPIQNTDGSIIIRCACGGPSFITFSVVLMSQHRKEMMTTDAGDVPVTTENTISDNSTGRDDEDGLPISKEIFIGIIIGTTLIIIIVIWIIVALHKRKRKLVEVQATDINYENLPEHNEGPMPVPPQWNDYTTSPMDETYTYCEPYIAKNVEDMYAQPQPKGQRQPELLYAEVGAQEPTYAAVGQESESLYVNKHNQMPAYSQIQPKKLRENAGCAPKVLPKPANNQNYAQVVPKSIRKQSEYENVFKNQRYINADAKGEYTEPAYCEVSK